jgi:hypothetical protein
MFGFISKKRAKATEQSLSDEIKNLQIKLSGQANEILDLSTQVWDYARMLEKSQLEVNQFKESLNILKDFCVKKNYDLEELLGYQPSKPIYKMTGEEIVARNGEINERQRKLVAVRPPEAVAYPANEELVERYEKNQPILFEGIPKYLTEALIKIDPRLIIGDK